MEQEHLRECGKHWKSNCSFCCCYCAVEVTRLIQGKTPVDILLVPFVSILIGGIITLVVGPYLTEFILWLGQLINTGVSMQPILMSIVVAVLMGMALTAPISSAAIGVMLGLNGLAAGAALAGLLWANDWICSYVNR